MKNDNIHFTPQQISKLLNLHIKNHKCIAVKCQNERQQLLNTIEKLAKNFYEIYKMFENQKREMNRIVNLYNDFCTQFGLPGKVETTKQHELSHVDKIASMIYEHFIKMREVSKKNKMHQSFDEMQQTLGPTIIGGRCNRNFSGAKKHNKSESSSSSVIAIDQEKRTPIHINENTGNKIWCNNSLRETNNGKRSFNSVLVNNGSIPATNSSHSPPEGVPTRLNCHKNHCAAASENVTLNFIGKRMSTNGSHFNSFANDGETTLICERGKKRHISAENEFGILHKKIEKDPQSNGSTFFDTLVGSNAAFLTKRPCQSTDVISLAVQTQDSMDGISPTGLGNQRASLYIQSTNKNKTPASQQFSTLNRVGGTVLITEGRELSIGHLSSSTEKMKNKEKQHNADIVIQLDDDD